MKRPPYANELEWRHVVTLQFIELRTAIYQISFVIALIAAGFVTSSWWPDAIAAAVFGALAISLVSYYKSARSSQKSEKQYSEIDYN